MLIVGSGLLFGACFGWFVLSWAVTDLFFISLVLPLFVGVYLLGALRLDVNKVERFSFRLSGTSRRYSYEVSRITHKSRLAEILYSSDTLMSAGKIYFFFSIIIGLFLIL
jgi:hypothetical protein